MRPERDSLLTDHVAEVEGADGRQAAAIPSLVLEPIVQHVRCLRLASGRLVYEFWMPGGKKSVRIDADVYEDTLDRLRSNPQEDTSGLV